VKQIRKRLTYANVMSSIAVFIVLGGAAIAAVELPKNSVGTKQLKKNAVTKAKIKKDAVNSSKVAAGSLEASDFKAGQLPAGPKGDKGEKGDTGPIGPSNGFSSFSQGNVSWTGADQTLRSISLPAGSYVLNAFVTFNNNENAAVLGRCRIEVGGSTVADTGDFDLDIQPATGVGGTGTNDSLPAALSGGGTLASDGTAQLICDAGASGFFDAMGLTAIRVGTLNG
jgi:hypothetical protein